MTIQRWRGLLAGFLVLVAGAAAGCGGGPVPPVDGEVRPGPDPDPDPTRLGATHAGWRNPMCLDCHGVTAPYPHGSEHAGPEACGACHGFNGAPHADHALPDNGACLDCHSNVVHVGSFQVPLGCVSCHQHPDQP